MASDTYRTRNIVATTIAVIFHSIGFAGIVLFDKELVASTSYLNLLLMFGLLVYTQPRQNLSFWIFLVSVVIIGIGVELIGTSSGLLFGDYEYGKTLGPSIANVPLIIGVNWFIIIYCCGISVQMLLERVVHRLALKNNEAPVKLKALSIVFDGAMLAVFFDWLMEPVAIELKYWTWKGDGAIPVFNYVCWFIISALLLFLFHRASFVKENKFAVNLLLIQAMFFLLLRTFL
jgi:bisanhydrobacterioruberin hydratase